jgi:hypothetical protein
LSSDPSGAFFSWNLTSINGVNGASSGSGNIITDGLVSSDSIPGSVVYEIGAGLNGCNAVHVQDTVTVKPLPDVIVTPSVSTICSGAATNVQITSSQAGASYSWFATSNNVSGIYNGSGNYINQTLSVSVSSDSAIYSVTPTLNGCQGTATIAVVYVNPLPVINICGFNQSICSGESTNIYLQSQNAVNATFSWTATSTWVNGCGGGNGNTIAQNLTLNGSVPGSVVYNVTAIDSGCSASCSFTINVNPVPSVSITTALPDTICANYNPVLLAGNPAGGIFTGTGIVNSVFYPNLPGTGYSPIAYEFTNALGCSATAADSIYIDVCTGTEQVREIKSQDFSISPNPAAAKVKFTIRVPKEDRVWISIMDDKGREVFSSAVFRVESIYEYYFDVFGWGKGFYNVTLHGSNETITRKMIVADK